MPKAHKIVFVAQHPIHYHSVIYRRAGTDPELEAETYFMQEAWASGGFEPEFGKAVDWGVPLTAGYRWMQFKNVSPRRDAQGFLKFINPGLIWRIFHSDHSSVYIHGGNYLTHVGCMLAARLSGKRLVLRSITHDLNPPSGLKEFVRKWIYRALFKLPTKFLYIGSHNANFFRNHGVPESKLIYAPHIVDNDFFRDRRKSLKGQEMLIKHELGIAPDKRVMAFVGKLAKRKQPALLLKAFQAAKLDNWVLVFVGDGDQIESLKALAAEAGLPVVFTGFLDQNEICRVYLITDIIVLPSSDRETWGLVVNEALNFGCAVIASDQVGCAVDLVEGRTGLMFPASDASALTDAIRRLAHNGDCLAQMQENAVKLIERWDVERYMVGLKESIGLLSSAKGASKIPELKLDLTLGR